MPRISPRQHALLSLGLLLAVITLSFSAVVLPAINSRIEFHMRLDEIRFQYSQFSRIIQETELLKQELERLRLLPADQTGFLEEKAAALAAADLQEQLALLIARQGGNLISSQVVNERSESLFPEVTIKIQMRGNIESLQKVLYETASGTRVLMVDNLLVQQRNQTSRRTQLEADLLDIQFDVSGYLYQSDVSQ